MKSAWRRWGVGYLGEQIKSRDAAYTLAFEFQIVSVAS